MEAPDTVPGLPYERLQDCTHCGLCLPYCPTYRELGVEMDSPRGRIYLVKALEDGRLSVTSGLAHHLELCVGCRACETACPSDVQFGWILEHGRSRLGKASGARGSLSNLLYGWLLPRKERLVGMGRLLQLLQRSPLHRLLRGRGLQPLLDPTTRHALEFLTSFPARPQGLEEPATPAPESDGPTVALLLTCLMRVLLTEVNDATIRVLARSGCRVVVPPAQECCGALHAHVGRLEEARALAQVNIEAFEASQASTILTNSAGCGAHLKNYPRLFAGRGEWEDRAAAFSDRVQDLSEFLATRDPPPEMESLPMKVAYDDPCHLLHGQGISQPPRHLLERVPDLELVPLEEADWCCGSAGTYMLTQPEMADRLLRRKVAHIRASGAEVVATGNPGCLLWIAWGLRREGLPVECLHPVQLLDRATS